MGRMYIVFAVVIAFMAMTACKNEKPASQISAETGEPGFRNSKGVSSQVSESTETPKEFPKSAERISTEIRTSFVSEETPLDLEDAILIAKVLYGECCWCSAEQQAAVVWTILNRVDAGSDAGFGDSVAEVVAAPLQFAYSPAAPVLDHLLEISEDVLARWALEHSGVEDVGRILPGDYCWFSGDGVVNYFRNWYRGGTTFWDWSLPSPYEGGEGGGL